MAPAHEVLDESSASPLVAYPIGLRTGQRIVVDQVEYIASRNPLGYATAELAASGPVNARLYLDLATQLAKLGRREEVPAALARARRIAKNEGDSDALRQVDEMMRASRN